MKTYEQMLPHQQRVADEKAQLDGRIEKILAFLNTTIYSDLPLSEQYRLTKQSGVMMEYSTILGERIAAF